MMVSIMLLVRWKRSNFDGYVVPYALSIPLFKKLLRGRLPEPRSSASVTMAGFSNAFLIRVDLGVSERLTLSISMNYDLLLKF